MYREMKKFIIFSFIIFYGCSNSNYKFNTPQEVLFKGKTLCIGDILIKEKSNKWLTYWGHSSIIISENLVGDFPKLGKKYYEISLQEWLSDNRKVLVLRYKNINKKIQNEILKNIEKYKDKQYWISSKKSEESFYCSKFIWFVYKKSSEKENLDLDSNKGILVFPYDFIESDDLEIIEINYKEEL